MLIRRFLALITWVDALIVDIDALIFGIDTWVDTLIVDIDPLICMAQIHGDGVFRFFGNKYSGQWEYNAKSGIGTFELVTGETYHGEWKDDKPRTYRNTAIAPACYKYRLSYLLVR